MSRGGGRRRKVVRLSGGGSSRPRRGWLSGDPIVRMRVDQPDPSSGRSARLPTQRSAQRCDEDAGARSFAPGAASYWPKDRMTGSRLEVRSPGSREIRCLRVSEWRDGPAGGVRGSRYWGAIGREGLVEGGRGAEIASFGVDEVAWVAIASFWAGRCSPAWEASSACSPSGLTNRSLREPIPGTGPRQMTYDLRDLRRKGLIQRTPALNATSSPARDADWPSSSPRPTRADPQPQSSPNSTPPPHHETSTHSHRKLLARIRTRIDNLVRQAARGLRIDSVCEPFNRLAELVGGRGMGGLAIGAALHSGGPGVRIRTSSDPNRR